MRASPGELSTDLPVLPPHLGRHSSSGIPRRDFLSICTAVSALLGLGPDGVRKVQAALAAGLRQPVLWLHFAECTGCSESLLRSTSPYFDDLILKSISLDYHETVMVDAGEGAEALRAQILSKYAGDFLCVVEGSIPTASNGEYGTIGSQTMYGIAAEVLPKAKAIIAIGSCSSDGGVASAAPNPAGVRSVTDAFPSLKVPVIKCPGCPPNPINFVAILTDYLLKGTTPELDSAGRPTFAHGKTVHQQCPLLGTAGCLQSQGCRGIAAFHNCSKIKFNEGASFCQQAGHVCIACSEAGFWDKGSYWDATFWKSYPVKVDAGKAGFTYSGDPNGIASTNSKSDAGVGGTGGQPGVGGQAGTGGGTGGQPGVGGQAGTGGRMGGGGATGSGGRSGAGGSSGTGGAAGGATASGGSAGSGGSSGSGGILGSGGGSGLGGSVGGSPGSGGLFGGAPGEGGAVGFGGNTTAAGASAQGCGCDLGLASPRSLVGSLGTVAVLGAVASKLLRRKADVERAEGEACPASSSTPSPASKDT
jgi:[NiFe] hydrogenase small subunit